MKSHAKSVKVSTRKVRLVADSIRNQSVIDALKILSLTKKHGAYVLKKALESAVANAVAKDKMREDQLMIQELLVNEGQFLKRFRASTRGRIHGYKKRTSHITIVLKEKPAITEVTKKSTEDTEKKEGEQK